MACQSYGQIRAGPGGISLTALRYLAVTATARSGVTMVQDGGAPAANAGHRRERGPLPRTPAAAGTPRDAGPPGDPAMRRGRPPLTERQPMPASPGLAITIHYCGRRTVLRLRGELDVCTRNQLRLAIDSALEHPGSLLVVDLSALRFMDCSGLSVLVWAHQQLAEQECQLRITGAQPIVARLIELTGLDAELNLSMPDPVAQRPGAGRRAPFGNIRRHLERNRSAQRELMRAPSW